MKKVEIEDVMKGKILQESHDMIVGGHHGINKIDEAIK
jgi:hypothetical protein